MFRKKRVGIAVEDEVWGFSAIGMLRSSSLLVSRALTREGEPPKECRGQPIDFYNPRKHRTAVSYRVRGERSIGGKENDFLLFFMSSFFILLLSHDRSQLLDTECLLSQDKSSAHSPTPPGQHLRVAEPGSLCLEDCTFRDMDGRMSMILSFSCQKCSDNYSTHKSQSVRM